MSQPNRPARRLIVMRHAKSSWANSGQADHDRPLNARGRRDAPCVARHLDVIGWAPDFALSSNSRRTRETWALMHDQFATREAISCEFTPGLYLAGYPELVDEVSVVHDSIQTLLVLGHNPGWEGIVFALSGEAVTLKTANAALLEGEGDTWQAAIRNRGRWRRTDLVVSRELND